MLGRREGRKGFSHFNLHSTLFSWSKLILNEFSFSFFPDKRWSNKSEKEKSHFHCRNFIWLFNTNLSYFFVPATVEAAKNCKIFSLKTIFSKISPSFSCWIFNIVESNFWLLKLFRGLKKDFHSIISWYAFHYGFHMRVIFGSRNFKDRSVAGRSGEMREANFHSMLFWGCFGIKCFLLASNSQNQFFRFWNENRAKVGQWN